MTDNKDVFDIEKDYEKIIEEVRMASAPVEEPEEETVETVPETEPENEAGTEPPEEAEEASADEMETEEAPEAETEAAEETEAEEAPGTEAEAEEEPEEKPKKDRKKAKKSLKEKKSKPEKAEKAEKKEKAPKEKTEKGKRWKIGLIIAAVIFVGIFTGITFAGYKVSNNGVVAPHVTAGGVEIGGMTREQAVEAVKASGWEENERKNLEISAFDGQVTEQIDFFDAGRILTSEGLVDAALETAHSGNLYKDLFSYLDSVFHAKESSDTETVLNDNHILASIESFASKFDAYMSDTDYTIDSESNAIRFHKGAGQVAVDKNVLFNAVSEALRNGQTAIRYDISAEKVKEPDFEALSKELNVEVQDSVYDPVTNDALPDVKGYVLEVDKAKEIWDAAPTGTYVDIPVTVHEPEITQEYLRSILFRDLLAETTTYYGGSTSARCNNIALAAGKINGLIMNPGDVFSYNGTVGERTQEAGFQMAGAYQNGQVVQELGGGICQVSSTIYCTTLKAQLETVERTCHQFRVDYLDPGYDATVSWPDVDLKFKNSRDYPVKILAIVDEDAKSITVQIWGTNLDGSYAKLSYGVGYIYDSEYPSVLIATSGVCYRTVYDADGNVIDEGIIDYSVYNLHDWEIKWPSDKDKTESGGGGGGESGGGGGDSGESGGGGGGDSGIEVAD